MRRLLKCDGTSIDLPDRLTVAQIHQLVGNDNCDHVTLWNMGDKPLHVMFVDGDGWEAEAVERRDRDDVLHIELRATRARLPVNDAATHLYHAAGYRKGHQIVGDAVIVPDDDYEDAP